MSEEQKREVSVFDRETVLDENPGAGAEEFPELFASARNPAAAACPARGEGGESDRAETEKDAGQAERDAFGDETVELGPGDVQGDCGLRETSAALVAEAAEDTSILRDLAPLGGGGAGVAVAGAMGAQAPNIDEGGRTLVKHYREILEQRAVYYPVAYRFPKELGRGRQGVVFLGLRQGARGCVTRHAIKLFDPGIYSTAKKYWGDMARIAAQTSKLQLVKNPSLVAPDVYEESNGIGYVQMEVVDGVSLRELLDGAHLEQVRARSSDEEWRHFTDVVFRLEGGKVMIQPGVALYIMRQALRGLETLHEMGFVHSDVKPANLMIDRLGYVKVIDYGRAMMADEKISLLLGTPVYMAPETHRERVARVRSDLYSLGMVGLEMLRGERLFAPGEMPDTEEGLWRAKCELPGRLYEILPEHVRQNDALVGMLRRFLDPEPERRYASAEQAEMDGGGLADIHKQLTLAGKDSEYGRELEDYLAKIVNPLGPG